MRHDAHYVEELSSQSPAAIGRMISVEQLDPNPEQPRVEIGDLTELTTSVKEKGVLEPLLVKPSAAQKGRWMIIAGERRWRAARAAGLREVPCIEMDVDEAAKPFTFKFHLPTPNVKVELKFQKAEVEKAEIVAALKSVLNELENS
jgi:hypothetical protein